MRIAYCGAIRARIEGRPLLLAVAQVLAFSPLAEAEPSVLAGVPSSAPFHEYQSTESWSFDLEKPGDQYEHQNRT